MSKHTCRTYRSFPSILRLFNDGFFSLFYLSPSFHISLPCLFVAPTYFIAISFNTFPFFKRLLPYSVDNIFFGAPMNLYTRSCPSVGRSIKLKFRVRLECQPYAPICLLRLVTTGLFLNSLLQYPHIMLLLAKSHFVVSSDYITSPPTPTLLTHVSLLLLRRRVF